ncbi:28 kDa heat- and acid-stable phosphoprotein-like isoform X2 [Dreissena polymorpha]|uniref:28 kDa heat- and acid-stable phosphoprotein-like isoform X2 n=1 Tax=Dreissena polymorpha TaxID=45954 RepID=UPI002263BE87|nr:28 kDa heat- and acid-stable phosphoprotein-like isoform X2 [Dreissena polymorpha]
MPRGGGRPPKKNYKGRSRQFTDEETLSQQLEKERKEKEWRAQRGEVDDDEETAEGGAEGVVKEKAEGGSGSESGSSDSESDEDKPVKGVSHLIDIENPNRALKKTQKLSTLDTNAAAAEGPQLSRREREEIEKQKAKERYQKMHTEGKTDEARADLARLALIRKQREEAAKKREEERVGKPS